MNTYTLTENAADLYLSSHDGSRPDGLTFKEVNKLHRDLDGYIQHDVRLNENGDIEAALRLHQYNAGDDRAWLVIATEDK